MYFCGPSKHHRSRKLVGSLQLGGWVDNEKWDQVIPATVETMIRFEAAIRPHLKNAIREADSIIS